MRCRRLVLGDPSQWHCVVEPNPGLPSITYSYHSGRSSGDAHIPVPQGLELLKAAHVCPMISRAVQSCSERLRTAQSCLDLRSATQSKSNTVMGYSDLLRSAQSCSEQLRTARSCSCVLRATRSHSRPLSSARGCSELFTNAHR